MDIRKVKLDELDEVSQMIIGTIDKVNVMKKDYNQKQYTAWKQSNSPEALKEKINKGWQMFVAVENGNVIGTVSIFFKKEKIYSLFVKCDIQRKGIGKRLLEFIEKYAKKKGLKKVYLTATPSAYGFYEREGFKYIKDVNIKIKGVDFVEPLMQRELK